MARVLQQIPSIQLEDGSGMMYLLAPGTARKLATAAFAGRIKLIDFTIAPRSLMSSAAPDRGSIDELRESWALARLALWSQCLTSCIMYNVDSTDTAILQVDTKMHAFAKSIRIDSGELTSWISRLVRTTSNKLTTSAY